MQNKYEISVLVVEDEPIISIVYDEILKNIVYYHQIVQDGESALESFTNNKFDLIISDIMLPGIDGLELIKLVRKVDKYIQVVFASARDNAETLTQAISLGVTQYLIKPND